jgi:hypothetical protein
MPGRKTRFMCPRQDCVNTPRTLTRVALTLFIGAFLLPSYPRVGYSLQSYLPNRGSTLTSRGDFHDGVMAGRSLKDSDFQSETRLWAGKVWAYRSTERSFGHAAIQSTILYDLPTAGLFLIRSPPSALLYSFRRPHKV